MARAIESRACSAFVMSGNANYIEATQSCASQGNGRCLKDTRAEAGKRVEVLTGACAADKAQSTPVIKTP